MAFSALDDHAVLSIASYGAPEDLLSLALTCRRLGSKIGAATQREWRRIVRDATRQKTIKTILREWSLMDEAARGVVEEIATEEEKACVPLRDGESWMGRYNELLLLRRPLTFDQLFGYGGDDIVASDDKTKVHLVQYASHFCTALSNHIMRAGKHYASFTATGNDVRIGVFRSTPGLADKGLSHHGHYPPSSYSEFLRELDERWRDGNVNRCVLDLLHGCGYSSCGGVDAGTRSIIFQRQGQETFGGNDTAGMLLDLDAGTLAVYKNGRRLGVLKSGLAGAYCWGATIAGGDGVYVKISRGPIPELLDGNPHTTTFYEI